MRSKKRESNFTDKAYLTTESSIEYDGMDDYINLGTDSKYNFSTEFTISFLVKINGNGNTGNVGQNNMPIVVKGTYDFSSSTSSNHSYIVGYNTGGGKFVVGVVGSDLLPISIGAVNTEHTYETGRWYHVTGVYKASQYLKLYVDGRLVGIRTDNIPASLNITSEPLYSGRNTDFSTYCQADVAHIAMFDRELDQNEIEIMHTWGGYIPESTLINIVDYQPLQYNNFKYDSVFRSNKLAQTAVL